MMMCLFGGGQGPSGGTLRGTGVGCQALQHGARVVSWPPFVSYLAGYHLVLVPLSLLYSWRHQQFAPTAVPLQESPPRSLPWCSDGAGEEQPLGNEGVYCCLQLIRKMNESSYLLLAGCDSGFYHDCFCGVAGWSSALGAPGDTFVAVIQVLGPSKLPLGLFAR